MSVGASLAGIDTAIAVELDRYAAATYKINHKNTEVFNCDIRRFNPDRAKFLNQDIVLFGGPPCQGFSSSNQKTRNFDNKNNWLFKEFIRITKSLKPKIVIIENVKGIIETENSYFFETILKQLKRLGYTTSFAVLNAANYGVPQIRNRVFIVGALNGLQFKFPEATIKKQLTVNEAITDLPILENGADFDKLNYQCKPKSKYQTLMRSKSKYSVNNKVTRNSDLILQRYRHIPHGGNWQDIPSRLMRNYKDFSRCHTGIYHRLNPTEPSVVIGNFRKNMLIHPYEHRGLSIREAARIQSFPDDFHFVGSIGFQQQQVGNSVPPLLAKAIFDALLIQLK